MRSVIEIEATPRYQGREFRRRSKHIRKGNAPINMAMIKKMVLSVLRLIKRNTAHETEMHVKTHRINKIP